MSTLFLAAGCHSVLPERMFSLAFYLSDPLHCLDSRLYQFTIITNGDVSSFFKVDSGVDSHLFTRCFSKRLCPPHFSGIALHFEVFVAFGGTKSENFCIVSHERRAVSWVYICRTEVTLFNSHSRECRIRIIVTRPVESQERDDAQQPLDDQILQLEGWLQSEGSFGTSLGSMNYLLDRLTQYSQALIAKRHCELYRPFTRKHGRDSFSMRLRMELCKLKGIAVRDVEKRLEPKPGGRRSWAVRSRKNTSFARVAGGSMSEILRMT